MKVIIRAIDDIALYQVMRELGKELTEEEIEFEASAQNFLFNDDYRIPMSDYLVDVTCTECQEVTTDSISLTMSQPFICSHCGHQPNQKNIEYSITENQTLRDISLQELIELWGITDIEKFRLGIRSRIEESVDKKLKK